MTQTIRERHLLYKHAIRPIQFALVSCLVLVGAAVLISSFQITQNADEIIFGASFLFCISFASLLVAAWLRVTLRIRRYLQRPNLIRR